MAYLSVAETAKKWNLSERSVRNYCAAGRVPGAFLTGKTWNVPEDAEKPGRVSKKRMPATLLEILKDEKASKRSGGIYPGLDRLRSFPGLGLMGQFVKFQGRTST